MGACRASKVWSKLMSLYLHQRPSVRMELRECLRPVRTGKGKLLPFGTDENLGND
jgi:hypothetical protein